MSATDGDVRLTKFARLLSLTLLALLSLNGGLAAQQQGELLERVLVRVNGEILTKTDLESRQIQALRDQERAIDPERLKNDAEMQKMLREAAGTIDGSTGPARCVTAVI